MLLVVGGGLRQCRNEGVNNSSGEKKKKETLVRLPAGADADKTQKTTFPPTTAAPVHVPSTPGPKSSSSEFNRA